MIIGLILITLVAIGTILITKSNWEFIGLLLTICSAIWFFIHITLLLLVNYNYNIFIEKRNAFELTLTNSRLSGSPYESAAIVKDVAEWNIILAKEQYDNKIWFFGQYIDDRIDDLKPIK